MLQEKLKSNKKIEIIWDTVVEDVIGTKEPKTVNALKIKNVKDNKVKELKVDGLFIAIGHDPATSLFKDCLLYTSPSPRDATLSRMPSSA